MQHTSQQTAQQYNEWLQTHGLLEQPSPDRITDKLQMRELYLRSQFGNRFAGWSFPDYVALGLDTTAGLMYNGTPGIRLPDYCKMLDRDGIIALADRWERLGYDKRRITVSCGDGAYSRRLMQGEVMRSDQYMDLLWTDVDDVMRVALATRHYYHQGAQAQMIVKRYMDSTSWDTLHDIWDRYPDAVVEFTVYGLPQGIYKRNTIFWEARNY